jgi:hypothetical protein
MTPHPRLFLIIDARRNPPHFGASDGKRFGTLRMLGADDIAACALWLARTCGRAMLDAFELRLLQDGCIGSVQLQDEDGTQIQAEAEVVAIERDDEGLYLRWQSKFECSDCAGLGDLDEDDIDRLKLHGEPGPCKACGGEGHYFGSELVTDYDGRALPGQGRRSFAHEQWLMNLGWR